MHIKTVDNFIQCLTIHSPMEASFKTNVKQIHEVQEENTLDSCEDPWISIEFFDEDLNWWLLAPTIGSCSDRWDDWDDNDDDYHSYDY